MDIKDTAAETGDSVFPDIAAATYAISQIKVEKASDRMEILKKKKQSRLQAGGMQIMG